MHAVIIVIFTNFLYRCFILATLSPQVLVVIYDTRKSDTKKEIILVAVFFLLLFISYTRVAGNVQVSDIKKAIKTIIDQTQG